MKNVQVLRKDYPILSHSWIMSTLEECAVSLEVLSLYRIPGTLYDIVKPLVFHMYCQLQMLNGKTNSYLGLVKIRFVVSLIKYTLMDKSNSLYKKISTIFTYRVIIPLASVTKSINICKLAKVQSHSMLIDGLVQVSSSRPYRTKLCSYSDYGQERCQLTLYNVLF